MYILTYMYILADIPAYHLQLKCMGDHFSPGDPYIESTTILSDYIITHVCISIFTNNTHIITMYCSSLINMIVNKHLKRCF